MLSEEQLATYRDDGVLVIPNAIPEASCDALRARMDELVAGFDPKMTSTVFSTTEVSHGNEDWFLSSGDKVRFFFEDGALDDNGVLVVPLDQAINKVGHALHDLDPVFDAFSRQSFFADLAADLGYVDPRLLQSMYIFKQPGIGGEVSWHCDHTFLWTEPLSVTGFWVALEDADEENGCLWFLPASHNLGPKSRFRRHGSGTVTEVLDHTPYDAQGARPVPVSKGAVVVLHGAVAHWSAPNRSARSRHAYTLHIIEGTAEYPADNWLQREVATTGFTQIR